LGQIIEIPNQYGRFLDLVSSNVSADVAMWTCESLLLKLDTHHRAYELSVNLRFCKYKAIGTGREWFKIGAADCKVIIKELSSVDWHGIFSRKSVDQCTDMFNDIIWSCFGSFVPKTSPHCVHKFHSLQKNMKNSEQW
jgi:hypothetical protein